MKNYKIAAVVVTYNRLEELKKNIAAIKNQSLLPDKIYIIDNASTDKTADFTNTLDQNLFTSCRLNKNCGGAGGFAFGLKKAIDDGFDWVWLMDDDGRPQNADTLKILTNKIDKNNTFALYNCNVLNDGENLSFNIGDNCKTLTGQRKKHSNGLILNYASLFNGSLFGRELIKKAGNIRGEFFIRGDEAEYLLRCKNTGAFICTVIDSLYFHPSSQYGTLSFFGKKLSYEAMPVWKEYFLIRNYSDIKYSKFIHKSQKKNINKFINLTLLSSFLYNKNLKRMFLLLKAKKDGKKGIFDNYFRK